MSERQIRHFASDTVGVTMCGEPFETPYGWTSSGLVHDCTQCVTAFRKHRREQQRRIAAWERAERKRLGGAAGEILDGQRAGS